MNKITISENNGDASIAVESKDGLSGLQAVQLLVNAAIAICEDTGMNRNDSTDMVQLVLDNVTSMGE